MSESSAEDRRNEEHATSIPEDVSAVEDKTEEKSVATNDETPELPEPPVPVAKPKYRHDWYQTEADVCINILIKKLKRENVQVNFQEKSVSVTIKVEEDDVYHLSLALSHAVNVDKCSTKVYGSKVELRLRKCDYLHWESLEPKESGPKLKLPGDMTPGAAAGAASSPEKAAKEDIHKYPSSSHYTRDWDKLVAEVKQEEKTEKPEGDAALNKLFQQIYGDGSDEVKKAMNKSFMESGGTVLSTNWGDIGKGKVERKPPDGMEWKQYEK